MKKKIIIVSILIVALISYFGYKLYVINYYKGESKIEDIYGVQEDTIIINTNNNIVSNTKIGTMTFIWPKGFAKADESGVYFLGPKKIGTESAEFKASFNYGKVSSKYYNYITTGAGEKIDSNDAKELFNKYNIKNEVDLQKFGLKLKNNKNNIFSSTSRIKMEYIITNNMPTSEKIWFIDGDIKGYLLLATNNQRDFYVANIEYENDIYYFWFVNGTEKHFTIENITRFLNNIQFKE